MAELMIEMDADDAKAAIIDWVKRTYGWDVQSYAIRGIVNDVKVGIDAGAVRSATKPLPEQFEEAHKALMRSVRENLMTIDSNELEWRRSGMDFMSCTVRYNYPSESDRDSWCHRGTYCVTFKPGTTEIVLTGWENIVNIVQPKRISREPETDEPPVAPGMRTVDRSLLMRSKAWLYTFFANATNLPDRDRTECDRLLRDLEKVIG